MPPVRPGSRPDDSTLPHPPCAFATLTVLEVELAEKNPEKLYQAEYMGNGTFIIHKPKRNPRKLRQLRLKSPNPGMRK